MHWLYLDFPTLPIDILERNTLQAEPIAIYLPDTERIQWLNALAIQQGVQAGQSLHAANCLCPQLRTQVYSWQQCRQTLHGLAQWAESYSAFVSLHGDLAGSTESGLWLEAGSMRQLFGGIREWYQRLAEDLTQQGIRFRAACGHTPLACRWLAMQQPLAPSGSGAEVISDDRHLLQRHLRQLAVSKTDIAPLTRRRLSSMGIKTLGQLLDLPLGALAQRLGTPLVQQLNQLQGTSAHPLKAYQAPPYFERRLEVIDEITTLSHLLFIVKRLLVELMRWLQHRACGTDQLCLTLHHQTGPSTRCKILTAKVEYREQEFLELIRLQLEKPAIQQQLAMQPVCGVTLSTDQLQTRIVQQPELFSPAEAQHTGVQLVARLQARLGSQAVQQLDNLDDHRPEKSWCFIPVGSHTHSHASTSPQPLLRQASRPLWLLQLPQAVHRDQLQLLEGPERICTGWWDSQPVMRDYYRARFGSLYAWVFRTTTHLAGPAMSEHDYCTLTTGSATQPSHWFVHGWFA